MSSTRSGIFPLLFIVGGIALTAGLYVGLRRTNPVPLRVYSPAPPFSLPDLAGKEVSLEALRGRVVFVNFWATWCPPCRIEAPSLERLYRELKPEGFEILALSIDAPESRDAVAGFGAELKLSFPVLMDSAKRVYAAYGVTGVPETFMVDPAGRVTERFVGPRNWEDPRYARAIRRLLQAREMEEGAS